MTRMSKKAKRRAICPFKRRNPAPKTGALKDNLPLGYKEQANALDGEIAAKAFIPKVK